MLEGGGNESTIDGRTVSVEEEGVSSLGGSMDLRKAIALIGAFYWFVMTALVVPGAVVATYLLVLVPSLLCIPMHNWLDHRLCRMVNDHWVSASQSVGMNVIEYGDDITKIQDKRVLFLSNHLGLVDHFVLMCAMYNKGTIAEKYLWVIYNIWKATPLGAMWITHGNFFINGGASQRDRLLGEFKEHLKRNYWKYDHKWIVMYPEGSRLFLVRESNRRFAQKNGLEQFRNCVLPRSSGAHAVLDIAGKQDDGLGSSVARCKLGGAVEYVVDCTLGYHKGNVPELSKFMVAEFPQNCSTVGVHYKIYKAKAEWSDESKLKEWLYDRYEEKDQLLDYYYKHGSFPESAECRSRTVQFPLSRCVVVETFWIVLFYAHYSLWFKPLSALAFTYFSAML